jgi:diguanylate cyclase (GGDEF)-like protein
MTTITATEEAALGSALAALWQRHRQTNLDRISLLESTTANLLRGVVDPDAISKGAVAAHKLAGSLGTFGFDAGSRAALEAEFVLREPEVDGRRLAEAVTALRASVEGAGDGRLTHSTPLDDVESTSDAMVHVLSVDADLVSRLTVEAAAVGLLVVPSTEVESLGIGGNPPAAVIIDDDPARHVEEPDLLRSVAGLSKRTAVIVLTESDGLERRAELARCGAAGVMRRTQGARQTVSFLAETVDRHRSEPSFVLSFNTDTALSGWLHEALDGSGCQLANCDDSSLLWEALEAHAPDLVIIGSEGPQMSGAEMCQVLRADPRWHHLPVVMVGKRGSVDLESAVAAGADDYLSVAISARDLGSRLNNHLVRSRMVMSRSDTDPITESGNRSATEGSLDRLLGFARGNGLPFALALITVDEFDHIRQSEGNASGDVVLRRLGARLKGAFGGSDVVGRWTHDGFAVGILGAEKIDASERVTDLLRSLSAEGILTTSGQRAYVTFSAGVAAAPADGSSLSSLERICETSLGRARSGQNSALVSGEHPPGRARHSVDVVIVEDDDSMAEVIESALALRQHSSARFSDGAEAAKELGEGRIKGRIILLDVGLPSLDGFGVLQVLKSHGVLDESHVIMLTARSSEAEMLRALGLGATEHIVKPFSVPFLLGRLDQTLPVVAA